MRAQDQTFHYLKDFEALTTYTPELDMAFYLGKDETKVVSRYKVSKKRDTKEIFFNGEKLKFQSVSVDGETLEEKDYALTDKGISLKDLPEKETLVIEFTNLIEPNNNTDLEGLYVSGNILCTQNEPMGFRKITYAIDRPDNMVKVKTTLYGKREDYPFMLSNGNKVDTGKTEEGLSYDTWEDPFPKPLYLFALVAGELSELSDTYTTNTGRKIDIKFYCDPGAEHKCDFAIESLKKAMKWDEDRFSLEYDLDLYMVVAVDSFNMGAMENKGLNIFNSALVLADPVSATDMNYHRIESVIGHEYFHNWTGNRVTLENWFQLTLKEGLTVFRDQEFSSDLNDASVERIDMVRSLKERQFPEDAGPLAHPIRPEKYKEMNNFYTATVYEKGAEVIRMFHTLLGEEKFQNGMKDYFKLYDGKAITTEDFVEVMCKQDSKLDQAGILKWYKTPGTPHVEIKEDYDASSKELTVTFKQSNEVAKKNNMGFEETYIPVKFDVYEGETSAFSKVEKTSEQPFLENQVYLLKEGEQTLKIKDLDKNYQISYFQDFSAPVTYKVESEQRDLNTLAQVDQNLFNRYNAVQTSALYWAHRNEDQLESGLQETLKNTFKEGGVSDLVKANILEPISFNSLAEGSKEVNPTDINNKVQHYKKSVGEALGLEFVNYLKEKPLKEYSYTLEEKGHRALNHRALDYVLSSQTHKKEGEAILKEQFEKSDNMTTSMSCLMLSQVHQSENADEISTAFFEKYKDNGLTLQKWITAYLSCWDIEKALKRVDDVEKLEQYSEKVPNFVRALWGAFIRNNQVFHDESGKGYKRVLEAIERIDKINPQMSSGLMRGFNIAPRLKGNCGTAMKKELDEFNSKRANFSSHLKETFDSIYQNVGA